MLEQTVQIVSNERDTDSYFRLVLRAPRNRPADPARTVRPRPRVADEGRPVAPAIQHFSSGGRHVFHPLQNRRQGHRGAGADAGRRGTQRHCAARPRIHRARSAAAKLPCSSPAATAWRRCICWRNVRRKKASSSSAAGGAWTFCAKRNLPRSAGTCA